MGDGGRAVLPCRARGAPPFGRRWAPGLLVLGGGMVRFTPRARPDGHAPLDLGTVVALGQRHLAVCPVEGRALPRPLVPGAGPRTVLLVGEARQPLGRWRGGRLEIGPHSVTFTPFGTTTATVLARCTCVAGSALYTHLAGPFMFRVRAQRGRWSFAVQPADIHLAQAQFNDVPLDEYVAAYDALKGRRTAEERWA